MSTKRLKKGDIVKVITGKNKGKTGAVKALDKKSDRIKIEGVALCVRHYKARSEGEVSQKIIFERFIARSNVVLISAA